MSLLTRAQLEFYRNRGHLTVAAVFGASREGVLQNLAARLSQAALVARRRNRDAVACTDAGGVARGARSSD